MAKRSVARRRPAPPAEPVPLSDLAKWMVAMFGTGRLRHMRKEYMAGLPHTMNPRIRQDRIDAINEVFDPNEYHQYRTDPAQFL